MLQDRRNDRCLQIHVLELVDYLVQESILVDLLSMDGDSVMVARAVFTIQCKPSQASSQDNGVAGHRALVGVTCILADR